MKVKRPSEPDAVHPDADDDDMRALDQSEKEYSRMISQHATYHKMLMDDLITLSSGSGSGSGSGMMLEPGPAQQMLQQQMDQSKQTNLINGIGTTIGRMNSNRDHLMQSASKFAGKSPINSQTVARLNDSIRANGSDVLKTIHATTATKAPNATEATKATKATKATEGFAPNPTLDGALEVSTITRESHKYALVIFGIFASFLVYKTIKHL